MLFICAFGCVARSAWAIDVPPLQRRVTDEAQLLAPAQRAQLEEKLHAYELRTGRQFALLTVKTLGDEPIDMFGMRVAEAWKLGRKQGSKDYSDGLILILATDDHRSRIEVGYGLEADITDALASRVLRQIIKPAFRAQNYAAGIDQAFDILIRAADKSPVEGDLPRDGEGAWDSVDEIRLGVWVFAIIVFLLTIGPCVGLDLLLLLFGAPGREGRRRGPRGGGWGGGGGGFSGGGGSFGGGGASGSW